MSDKYKTTPDDIQGMPTGIPYIVGNEAAERFSFYGMKSILIVFMTKYLLDATGAKDVMSPEDAKIWYHSFNTWVYLFPLAGALLADLVFGKYRTILLLSVVYCVGHGILALDETRSGLFWGLSLIAIGSGGIKPCVSAHVGDQFSLKNAGLLERVFGWFYFSINLGAFSSTILTPILLDRYGPSVAFGIPGVLMGFATLLFWMGRNRFIHIPARPKAVLAELKTPEARRAFISLSILYLYVAMFWALFDQTGSAWVLQAEMMDREFLGIEWLTSQIQALNPIMILVFIPMFALYVYPWLDRLCGLTPMKKISIGLFLTVPAFLLPAWIQFRIQEGEIVNIVWQLVSYVLITAAEVFVSITCLEFSYTQAPKQLKSIVMALFLVSVSAGNLFVAGVNVFIQSPGPIVHHLEVGEYAVNLHVTDGVTEVEHEIQLGVVESLPTAGTSSFQPASTFLGNKATVLPGASTNLFATVNAGDSKGETSYKWSLITTPSGSVDARLAFQSKLYNTLLTDLPGEYVIRFEFQVGDTTVFATKSVIATETNLPPEVYKNDRQILIAKTEAGIPLDFIAAFDPDSDELEYEWTVTDSDGTNIRVENSTIGGAGATISATEYYLFFAAMMLLTALAFIPFAKNYSGKVYLQDAHPLEEVG
ncbi:MAG: POT family MFS transporter [Planctomycetaceae bacterium]|nr:POT family MFS transporter [Planctomycetaceae bacterium]